ncbi:hypothetical protein B0J18DRAFT_272577 [Chaetomium sp. MPI-SDFR-AT-0129]|nr:hypothetical protein B0J18DRAFT_272577 [Chaetomium sp. MPI-SDFR-AT-0129]
MPGLTSMLDDDPPSGGVNGHPNGSKRPGRTFPHIDDLVNNTTTDIDPHAPIDTLLRLAQEGLKHAESSRSFGRPDLALKEYLRTNDILLTIIPHSKDWTSLRRDRNKQGQAYNKLLKQVKDAVDDFEACKERIREDNARTGVQPTAHQSSAGSGSGPAVAQTGAVNGQRENLRYVGGSGTRENGVPASPPPRTKPVVHPKPQSLHGKAIRPGSATTPILSQDLVQRFASLRGAPDTAQSAHTRTQSAVSPSSVSMNGVITGLPRPPDAIYNPPRGTITSETAALPSSAPRGMFTRTNSTASLNGARNHKPQPPPPQLTPVKRPKLSIPDGDTITSQELFKLMQAGARDLSILVIDIRSREEFDDGHIMSQATICLEPEVLSRHHISANDLAESMVLAPNSERLLFEKRHEFGMVVYYDYDSVRISDRPQDPQAEAVLNLYNALSHYDFDASPDSRVVPKLLRGGLEAWIGLVGSGSLQSSTTATTSGTSTTPMVRSFASRRRQTYVTRPIQDAAEAKRWEETIAEAGGISPIRTTEDFLRRFPPISEHRESMVSSPVSPPASRPQSPFHSRLSHEENLYTSLPSPPMRPPPAIPRRSYSGLAEAEDSAVVMAKKAGAQAVDGVERKHRTGLQNPGVFCFANSSLQAMFATPGFAQEVWTGAWKGVYKVPMKPDENLENPQLLTKCLANLFHWLNQGSFQSLAAKTFMEYIHFIHAKNVDGSRKLDSEVFGGCSQQDAQEFYSFIMDNIHDETNIRRDRTPPKEDKQYTPKNGSIIQNAIAYWRDYSQYSSSLIDKYFRGLEVFISRCQNPACRQEIRLFQPCDVWILNLAGMGDITDLDALLANHQTSEHFPDLICETCNTPGRMRKARFARLPDRLAFCLNRFNSAGAGGDFGFGSRLLPSSSGKIHSKVRFPIRDLDLTRYCAEPDPQQTNGATDRHFAGSMVYDCYAVTVHVGPGINGGHYYSYVQDEMSKDPTDWFRCNDEVVSRVKVAGGGGRVVGDVTEDMYQNGSASAYMVYYRRRGT